MRWIRLNDTLPESKAALMLARAFGLVTPDMAVGMLVRWFLWLDAQGESGRSGLHPEDVERVVRSADYVTQESRTSVTRHATCHTPFCAVLQEVGWIELEDDGTVSAVDYAKHNGADAKKHAQDAERQRRRRKAKAAAAADASRECPQNVTQERDENVTIQNRTEHKENSLTKVSEKESGAERDAGRDLAERSMDPEQQQQRDADRIFKQVPLPPTPDDVAEHLAKDSTLRMTAGDKVECARAFFAEAEGCGWIELRSGRAMADWRGYATRYAQKWAAHIGTPGKGGMSGMSGKGYTRNNNANAGHAHEYDI